LLLASPIYGISKAKRFIQEILSREFNSLYNFDYLMDYLTCHLTKYPGGKLPDQPAQVIYTGLTSRFEFNFINAQDERILKYIKPDFVHVFAGGKIVEQGGADLADRLEANGYAEYTTA
jgi:hypothetical protein